MALADIVSGLSIRCVELGKIKIGGLGERRKTREGREWRMPRKDDYFHITGLTRDANGDLVDDTALMQQLANDGHASPDGKLRQLPIRLLANDIDSVLQARYCWYGKREVGAVSDGHTVTWRYDPTTMQPCTPPRVEEWHPAMLELTDKAGNKLFKLHSNFYCSIYSQSGRWGGAYVFRTTSIISFKQLYASLLEISDKTGGVLVGMPLMLCVRPMLVAPDGKATNVYVVHVEIRGNDLQQLQRLALEQSEFRLKFASNIQTTERQYRKLLAAPGDEAPEEAAAIAAEFAPEEQFTEEAEAAIDAPRSKVEAMAAAIAPPAAPQPLDVVSQAVTEPEAAKQQADPTTAAQPPATPTGSNSVEKATGQPTTTTTAPSEAAAKTQALARQLQEQFPTGQHGTVAADAPAGAPPTAPPAQFVWKTATPEARTAYTLQQVKLVDRIADPTQGLQRLAKISQGIKEVDVGKPGYQLIMQAITAAERAFLPQEDDTGTPFPPDSGDMDVAALVELCNAADSPARLDELEQHWRDDANNFSPATAEAGLEEIAKARQGMRQ